MKPTTASAYFGAAGGGSNDSNGLRFMVYGGLTETLSLAEQRLQEKDFALMGDLVAKVVAREPSTGIYSMTDDTEVRHRIVRAR